MWRRQLTVAARCTRCRSLATSSSGKEFEIHGALTQVHTHRRMQSSRPPSFFLTASFPLSTSSRAESSRRSASKRS